MSGTEGPWSLVVQEWQREQVRLEAARNGTKEIIGTGTGNLRCLHHRTVCPYGVKSNIRRLSAQVYKTFGASIIEHFVISVRRGSPSSQHQTYYVRQRLDVAYPSERK
jgi:hypothetical protein